MRFGRETWSIEPPAGWSAWHDAECATMAADPEVGALQISAAFKESDVSHEDLLDFATDHVNSGARPIEVAVGTFEGITFCYGDDESHWQQWYLRDGRQALFVTYNCPADRRGVEDEVVNKALKTLSSTGAA